MSKKDVKNLKIAYIGGGSRGWAWKLMSDLASEKELCGEVYLYDIDHEAAKNNEIIGNKFADCPDTQSKWSYKAVGSLQEALTGTDFIVISILPGTFDEMESDVHTPEKYGIYQSVGDTVGPGGIIRALRTIPMYVEIAEAIKKYSPDAWVINYTNPMTLCVQTLYSVFPEIKAFGCCHEVFGTQKVLAEALKEEYGIEADRSEIKVNVLGINHFTWVNKASYKNIDLWPAIIKMANKRLQEGNTGSVDDPMACKELVKFDLLTRYGVLGAAGDRHLAEFCPNTWYLKDPKTVEEYGFALTTVAERRKWLKDKLDRSAKMINGEEEIKIDNSGEEGVRQMKAILGLEEFVTNVNLPNRGQIPNLPLGNVVETNAYFKKDSVQPVMAGNLPTTIAPMIAQHTYNQQLVLKAGLEKDLDLAFAAFVRDPLCGTLTLKDARELFNTMIKNTKKYLDGYKID